MNTLKIMIFLIYVLIISCSKNDETELDCLDAMLLEMGMTEYQGHETGFSYYLELYHYKQKQYYLVGSYHIEMSSYPIDCDGNKLCENGYDRTCEKFYNNATRIGIVGIK